MGTRASEACPRRASRSSRIPRIQPPAERQPPHPLHMRNDVPSSPDPAADRYAELPPRQPTRHQPACRGQLDKRSIAPPLARRAPFPVPHSALRQYGPKCTVMRPVPSHRPAIPPLDSLGCPTDDQPIYAQQSARRRAALSDLSPATSLIGSSVDMLPLPRGQRGAVGRQPSLDRRASTRRRSSRAAGRCCNRIGEQHLHRPWR